MTIDISLRYGDMKLWIFDDFIDYSISIALALAFWTMIAFLTLRTQHLHWLLAFPGIFAIFLIEIGLLILNYGYFFYFNAMPNFYSWEYILQEPDDVAAILSGSLTITHIMMLVLGASFLSGIWYWQISKNRDESISSFWAGVCMSTVIIGSIYMFNRAKIIDQSALPAVNSAAVISDLFVNYYIKDSRPEGSGLTSANRILLPDLSRRVPANLLIILNESLRRKSLHIYGNPQDTSPYMTAFLRNSPEEVFIFPHAYANATTTMLSLTSLTTGVSPVQPGEILHSMPLIFDYGKSLDYQTFFISAQSFAWRNFDQFFETTTLDYFWNKEIGFAPRVHDIGTDDRFMVREWKKTMRRIDEKPFVGIVHTNANHFPYFTEAPIKPLLQRYNASITFLDEQFAEIIGYLEENDLLNNTIVLFTSDHGEAFGEHGYSGHLRTYYEEESAIPFWIYIPGKLQKYYGRQLEMLRRNTGQNVSNLDIVPTVLDLLKYPELPDEIRDQFLGSSLLDEVDSQRTILMLNNNEISNYKIFLSLGAVCGDYKYLLLKQGSVFREELYNFRLDPNETNNLIHVHPDIVSNIHREIRKHESAKKILEFAFQQTIIN